MNRLYSIENFLLLIILSSPLFSQTPPNRMNLSMGDISEARLKPLVYINVTDEGILSTVQGEILRDSNGQLVLVTESAAADIIIAFLSKPSGNDGQDKIDPSRIGSDYKGQMIAYLRPDNTTIRVVWLDTQSNRPNLAIKEFIKALSKDRSRASKPLKNPTDPEIKSEEECKGKFSVPTVIHRELAAYEEAARQSAIQGKVILSVVLNIDGTISDIRVKQGLSHGLTARAVIAALKARLKPATCDGVPVRLRISLEYEFKLY